MLYGIASQASGAMKAGYYFLPFVHLLCAWGSLTLGNACLLCLGDLFWGDLGWSQGPPGCLGDFYTIRRPVGWYPEPVTWESYENISQAWSGVPRHSPEGPLPFQGSRYGENQTKATANKNSPYLSSPQTPARLGKKCERLCSNSLPSDKYFLSISMCLRWAWTWTHRGQYHSP